MSDEKPKDLPTVRVSPEHYEKIRKFAVAHDQSIRDAVEDAIDSYLMGLTAVFNPGSELEKKLVGVVQRIDDDRIRNQVLLDMYMVLR